MKKNSVTIKVKLLNTTAKLPTRERTTDAGWDLYCDKKTKIDTNNVVKVPTGIAIEIPEGYYAKIEERSGFAFNNHNTLKLKAGIIDSEYRGEVMVIMQNCGDRPIVIEEGTKFAQFILRQLPETDLIQVEELSTTSRGDKGFGSSDKQTK